MRVTRSDRGQLGGVTKTPQGFLRIDDSTPTRTGVLTYRNPDGSVRRELRHPDDVGNADSLATLVGAPVTDEHPSEMVTAENVRTHARGHTGEQVRLDGPLVKAGVTITDAGLIGKVERREAVELSCGYHCDLVMAPGIYNGEAYDARQTNIVYNHLAVVPRGRAGSVARLNLDAHEADDTPDTPEEGKPMTKINIDGVDYEVSEQVAAAYVAQQKTQAAKATTDAAAIATAQAAATTAQTKADQAEARADELDAKLKERTDAPELATLVKARVTLEKAAAPFLPANTNLDALDDAALKTAAIKAMRPETNLDGKSAAYIDARFDALVEDTARGHSATLAGNILARPTGDAKPADHDAARAKRQADLQALATKKEA